MADSEKPKKTTKSRIARTRKHKETKDKAQSWAKEWFDALIWAAVAAIIIRTLFFEAYRIPTPSMEQTLLTGDFLIVSKMSYGARSPMTIGIPFTSVHIKGVNLPWFRIPGFRDVRRNDIAVFNYPIDGVAISQKTNYIKRTIAIPGDTLEIRNKVVYINGELAEIFDTYEQFYRVTLRERLRLSESRVKLAGGQVLGMENAGVYVVNMRESVREELLTWPEIESIEPRVAPTSQATYARNSFTFRRGMSGTHDNIEPLVVPFSGMELQLSDEIWPIYRDVVERYEKNSVERTNGRFVINGVETDTYIVQKDYYFMMGDNRDNSEDSRFWGFVPDDHMVGTPALVYFSWDKERYLPRFGRLFSRVK